MESTGIVLFIDPTKTSGEGDKAFDSRVLALDTSVELNGTIVEGKMGFQATKQKCKLLDDINIGDEVKVTWGVRANTKQKEGLAGTEKNPNGMQIFTNLQLNKIEVISRAAAPPVVAPVEDAPF